jgi:hypothetical protein
MLYFAAATSYERARLDASGEFSGAFLLADDPGWLAIVRRNWQRLREETDIERLERELAESIAPFNVVGLCDPTVRNMYRHSALPE